MHFGIAALVDNPTEAWHSTQWASSIRTTSGEFAYYPVTGGDSPRDPIFPGDIIEYQCAHTACWCVKKGKYHHGQVFEIYRDERSTRLLGGQPSTSTAVKEGLRGGVVLVVGRLLSGPQTIQGNVSIKVAIKNNPLKESNFEATEQVLTVLPNKYITPASVNRRLPENTFTFDYAFRSGYTFADDHKRAPGEWFVRWAYHKDKRAFIPLCQLEPVAGTLEIQTWGRDALVKKFAAPDIKVTSLPLKIFGDGFALYRVIHKSIIGVYNEIFALPEVESSRQLNIFPLTLGPHGSNFHKVIRALEPMRALDKGLMVKVKGEPRMLCAPILAITGDMPQQAANSGVLGPVANQGYRFCGINSKNRGNLEFNTVLKARAHNLLERQRRHMDELPTKMAKINYGRTHGIAAEGPGFAYIAPALDLIAGRPSNAAHSEFAGITKMIHQVLLDQALKPTAVVEYCKVLRRMPFPPGWPSIQSPYHVLQYSLHEHARWSVLMTMIARFWLKESHLKVAFVRGIKLAFQREIAKGAFPEGTFDKADPSPVEIIVVVLRETVHMNRMLATDRMDPEERSADKFLAVVSTSRRLFQRLCKAAALASKAGGRGNTAASSLRAQSVVSKAGSATGAAAGKSDKYRRWASRPNVHIGLHYHDAVRRYGLVGLLMVLSGEKKHK
ncbi:hypothetical protein GGR56DRAFT_663844 [Xylariaceae sp. FL0804]|nr:hypothetical protein GGR56DRAFT_663844 [Xylariaceae sp. FL0804]